MSHDSTKVKLGMTTSSIKEVISHVDANAYAAGTAVRLKSDDTLSVTKSHGQLLGVSLGIDMSDTNKTAVCVLGNDVPILLTDDSAEYAYVVIGAPVYIDDVTGLANIVDTGDVTTTVTNAFYTSLPLDGINELGATVKVAKINMIGGI